MGTPSKVQTYMDKHKIGHLFESMMASVVKDMPTDPLTYLHNLIEQKIDRKQSLSILRKSSTTIPTKSEKKSSKENPMRKTTSSLPSKSVASWTGTVEQNEYEKPWKTNAKKSKIISAEKSSWDSTTKMTNKTFNELFDDVPAFGEVNKSKQLKTVEFAVINEEFSHHQGPKRKDFANTEEDLLAQELPLACDTNINQCPNETVNLPSHSKKKGYKADSERHRQELEELVKEKQKSQYDSGFAGEFNSDSEDEAIELLEDQEDLINEGITVTGKGSKLANPKPIEPEVKVTICARCAKVFSGSQAAPAYSSATSSNSSESTLLHSTKKAQNITARTGYSSYYDEEDEFESVSQVSGKDMRIPVWTNSDDDDDLTPRKGTHMLSSPRDFSRNGESKPAVKLNQDVLKNIPKVDNTVENFLGHKTWSPMRVDYMSDADALRQSSDTKLQTWHNDNQSDEDSTVMDWEKNTPSRKTKK